MNMTQVCGVHVIQNVSCDENTSFPSPLGMSHEAGFDVAIELYLISLIGILGLFGNVVSIVVLRQDRERREALLLLQALAVSDALYLVMALLRYPLKYLLHDSHQYHQMQVVVFPLLKTFQAITIWMLMLVTVDRYIYVCYPLKAQQIHNKYTRRGFVAGVYIFGILFTLPRYFEKCVLTFSHCDRYLSRVVYRSMFHNTYYYNIYLYGMFIVFLYIIPLCNLFIMNVRLIMAIKRSTKRQKVIRVHSYGHSLGHSAASTSYTSYSESNATLVLIIIIVVFIICETPECILLILTALEHHNIIQTISTAFFRYNTISALLMVVNSSVNFFIYFVFGRRFRFVFKETFIRLQSSMTLLTRESVPLNRQNLYG